MRSFSIRTKVTLWYTLFMIGLVAVILTLLIGYSGTALVTDQKNSLLEVVNDAVEDLHEGDHISYFEDGIYLLKYNADGQYQDGNIPTHFPASSTLSDGQIQTVKEESYTFYVYDQKVKLHNGGSCWIRGVAAGAQTSQRNRIILGAAFILLPFLVLFSSVIGFFLTKRAFAPVRQIQETAQKITERNELSMRIGLPEGKDEILKLGQTVDAMLDQLEQSFEREKQFTSDASHELRTPVTVILNESEYILQHGETFEEAKESMEVINRQANKMSDLINQLLFFTRAEKGAIKLQYELVTIPLLVKEIAADSLISAHTANISISTINKLAPPSEYYIDKVLFTRALQNLIQNAITYGKENGHIELTIYQIGNYFAVQVQDDGVGIASEHLDKIWNRFYQIDESRSQAHTGSMGLGLSMVKWITEKHGGYVSVRSTLHEGSRFTLYFPMKQKH